MALRARGVGVIDNDQVNNQTYGEEKPFKLTNLHGGDKLEVELTHPFNSIWGRVEKVKGKRWSNMEKNFALFSTPDGKMYAEITIWPERIVREIKPDEYDALPKDNFMKKRARRNFRVDQMLQRRVKTVRETTSTKDPLPSFFTVDEHWFPGKRNPFKEFAHGGACCVSFSSDDIADYPHDSWVGLGSIFVGVAHNVITYYATKRQLDMNTVKVQTYVSFFYAFDPSPPFDLLARSGYFCLGHASPSDAGMPNPRSALTGNRPLLQNNETFSCPLIHFVQTIVEKADDPSRVVIGYGLNDCTARLIEVPKKEVARLLFSRDLVVDQ